VTIVESVVVCARCGQASTTAVGRCPSCDGLFARTVLAPVVTTPPALGAVTASAARRAVAVTVSLAGPVVIGVVAFALTAGAGAVPAVTIAVSAALGVSLAELVTWVRRGRSLGNLVTATRTVRADDAGVLSWSGLLRPFRRRHVAPALAATQGRLGRWFGAVTVLARPGRDPLSLSASGPAALPPRRQERVLPDPHGRATVLTFDERLRIPLISSVVLGRNPAPALDADATLVALPDLSRLISKAHVRLFRDAGRIYAEDLGSTNGTQLVLGEEIRPMRPGEAVEVPFGAHLLLAGHPLRVDSKEARVAA
jgi:hypothetical protein